MAAAKPTINAHLPKVEIITKCLGRLWMRSHRRHKVIRFGNTRKTESDEEAMTKMLPWQGIARL